MKNKTIYDSHTHSWMQWKQKKQKRIHKKKITATIRQKRMKKQMWEPFELYSRINTIAIDP